MNFPTKNNNGLILQEIVNLSVCLATFALSYRTRKKFQGKEYKKFQLTTIPFSGGRQQWRRWSRCRRWSSCCCRRKSCRCGGSQYISHRTDLSPSREWGAGCGEGSPDHRRWGDRQVWRDGSQNSPVSGQSPDQGMWGELDRLHQSEDSEVVEPVGLLVERVEVVPVDEQGELGPVPPGHGVFSWMLNVREDRGAGLDLPRMTVTYKLSLPGLTQWAAVRTCLSLTRVPPHWKLFWPIVISRRAAQGNSFLPASPLTRLGWTWLGLLSPQWQSRKLRNLAGDDPTDRHRAEICRERTIFDFMSSSFKTEKMWSKTIIFSIRITGKWRRS